VPANLPADSYYVFLQMPDPSPALARRPEYCIRTANEGLWEASTGCNWLKASILLQ
jgi:hypothetical protein